MLCMHIYYYYKLLLQFETRVKQLFVEYVVHQSIVWVKFFESFPSRFYIHIFLERVRERETVKTEVSRTANAVGSKSTAKEDRETFSSAEICGN